MCIYWNNGHKWKHWFLCFIERYLTMSFAWGIISLTLFKIKTLENSFCARKHNFQRLPCICKLGLSILPLSTIFLLDFVPVWCLKRKKKLFIVCKLLIYGLTMRAMLDNIMTKNDQDYLINNAIFSGWISKSMFYAFQKKDNQ